MQEIKEIVVEIQKMQKNLAARIKNQKYFIFTIKKFMLILIICLKYKKGNPCLLIKNQEKE